ncbi:hypothetical protein [Fusibacter sp. 3D3]|nr:hypothetical protein [Fusibacter sp. 3D3]GAU77593.1 hypothetical protein F3D3_2222 [Fusibacter sp. 3D3]
MHHEDQVKVFITQNIRHKKELKIEDEGTRELFGIKPEIHVRIHKK